jgi:redox-sensitive bicupin YhaK (pirin superfamily)
MIEGTIQHRDRLGYRHWIRPGHVNTRAVGDAAPVLVPGGAPGGKRVVGYRPFVMSSEAEIAQAIRDFQAGRFGAR